MIQQTHSWACIWGKPHFKKTQALQCLLQHLYNNQDVEAT